MKRTKRYGGFLVGDRVRVKGKQYEWLKDGVVKALTDGYCSVYFKENSALLSEPVYYCFMPNQLINLTRIEDEHHVSKSLMNEKLKNQRDIQMALDFVNEALRQTELFLSPLTPCGSPLPSPYTRDVYTTTKDCVLQHKK